MKKSDENQIKTVQKYLKLVYSCLELALSSRLVLTLQQQQTHLIFMLMVHHGNDNWNGLNSTYTSGINGPKATIKNATGTVTI